MELRYHAATFELLRREPRFSAEAERTVAAREALCGRPFPAAVREWFALEGAGELFGRLTAGDELVPVERLGDPRQVLQGWLRVATERQGAVAWYVKLDGSDDPPVYDNDGEWSEDLTWTPWRAAAASFRGFIAERAGARGARQAGAPRGAAASGPRRSPPAPARPPGRTAAPRSRWARFLSWLRGAAE